MLLQAADRLRQSLGSASTAADEGDITTNDAVALSKEELEETAERFRADLGLDKDDPLDSLRIEVEDIAIVPLSKNDCIDARTVKQLGGSASGEWSAMSVPLDLENDRWAVLLNDSHTVERQRVTVLEEYWHILLGHKLTKISKVAEAFGRTYDATEEHDAYYLASASLLPKAAIIEAVSQNLSSAQIAGKFGTSSELVEYRIKRLGLWREYIGKQIKLTPG
jgi:Zn-dependent peptidase ImmA (M78 family)